jgi:hypothetical protein
MIELLTYILGYLITQTLCVIWFFSPFRGSLGYLFLSKQIKSPEDFETLILFKSPIMGKLLSCYICFSFWCSLFVGIILCCITSLPLIFALLAPLTYPCICYLYKQIVSKSE